jgi:hypothetical protein
MPGKSSRETASFSPNSKHFSRLLKIHKKVGMVAAAIAAQPQLELRPQGI